jgi:hypothetical protein
MYNPATVVNNTTMGAIADVRSPNKMDPHRSLFIMNKVSIVGRRRKEALLLRRNLFPTILLAPTLPSSDDPPPLRQHQPAAAAGVLRRPNVRFVYREYNNASPELP